MPVIVAVGESCKSATCKHGGICRNTRNGYMCWCKADFFGVDCESELFMRQPL